MIEFLGWAPDVNPTTPGVITDCVQLIPTTRAMSAAPKAVSIAGLGALPAACRGAAVVVNTAGTRRTIAGTQTHLYELSGGTWTGVDSHTFSGSSENRWSIIQFGNVAIAANDTDQLEASTAGTFAAVATAPKAKILVSVPNFVVALNTNDAAGAATYGDQPDRWWCCGFQDYTNWTPAVTTQCTTGRLIGSGGEITAGLSFGNGLVAYKARDMFLGQYVGPPVVFQFDRVPGDQGCVGPEAVTDIGGAHVFVGQDNIWLFDGSRPYPIATDIVRNWFFADLSATFKYRTIVTHDRASGRVWIFYPSTSSTGHPDHAIVYHLASKKWGRANRSITAALNYVSGGTTWDTVTGTWETVSDVPWDSQAWQSGGAALAVFDATYNLVTLTGTGENSGLTTGDMGGHDRTSTANQVRVSFLADPTTSSITGYTKDGPGEGGLATSTGTLANGKYDLRQTGNFHRFSFAFSGSVEVSGIDVRVVQSGQR